MTLQASISKVDTSSGRDAPPSSDDFAHDGATNADPSATVTETLSVPDRATGIALRVENADGSFSVDIKQSNTTITYSGDGTTPVDEVRAVNSPEITVEITGAATTVDYDIYVR